MKIDFNNFPGKFTRLVLSGGGPKGLAILGALHYIHESDGLHHIEEYWGTSIGSVISLLLLIGYTPFEIYHRFFMQDNIVDETTIDIRNILDDTAFCKIEAFGDKVRSYIIEKLATADPTFEELYKICGKKIHIMGANTDTMRGECFDVDTRPDMKVIDAIEISCDLPYIFTKKVYDGSVYVDGGFINNYAVNLADNGENYCLGICVFGDVKTHGDNLVGWIYRLLYMPIMELHRERLSRLSDRFTNVELTINNVSIIEIAPDKRKKIQVFSEGFKQARDILGEIEKAYKEELHLCSQQELHYEEPSTNSGWVIDWDWDDGQ